MALPISPVKIIGGYLIVGLLYGLYKYSQADADNDGITTVAEYDAAIAAGNTMMRIFSPVTTIVEELLIVAGLVTEPEVPAE